MKNLAVTCAACCVILFSALPALCDQKPKKDNIQKPVAGPRATALQVTWLYVSPDRGAQKLDRVQPGREMVIAEKSGHFVIVDRPDVVTDAISQVVQSVRNNAKL